MKRFKVFYIIMIILIVIAIMFLISSFGGGSSRTITIPEGQEWYGYIQYDMASGGSISISYSEINGRSICVYVFDSSSFAEYSYSGLTSPITYKCGPFGSISMKFTEAGKYYLVFAHAPGFEFDERKVNVNEKSTGLVMVPLLTSVIFLLMGIVFAVAGYRMMKSETSSSKAQKVMARDDIIFFDDK